MKLTIHAVKFSQELKNKIFFGKMAVILRAKLHFKIMNNTAHFHGVKAKF